MDDLQSHQLIIRGPDAADEEQRCISSVYNFRIYVYSLVSQQINGFWIQLPPLYSRKLHILVRRASTSCVTSFTILTFVFGAIVVNHFASRTLPDY